ncbi:unnamed protein product [Paramecium pentaurelia]|uniref:Uncharacterized protein n=1 Tax=Paramecium pentaurelia TaxID=43138 RepID=A0A8S1Y8D5_9CILI|nr:unnamed protein product [Paramecium pentaurelia]
MQAGQGLEETIRMQNQAKAIILTDRIIIQVADSFASPQGIIYYYTNMEFYVRHIQIELHVSRVAQLLKISEIYTVRRLQVTENRFADLQVFIFENDRITKIEFLMILSNLYRLVINNSVILELNQDFTKS